MKLKRVLSIILGVMLVFAMLLPAAAAGNTGVSPGSISIKPGAIKTLALSFDGYDRAFVAVEDSNIAVVSAGGGAANWRGTCNLDGGSVRVKGLKEGTTKIGIVFNDAGGLEGYEDIADYEGEPGYEVHYVTVTVTVTGGGLSRLGGSGSRNNNQLKDIEVLGIPRKNIMEVGKKLKLIPLAEGAKMEIDGSRNDLGGKHNSTHQSWSRLGDKMLLVRSEEEDGSFTFSATKKGRFLVRFTCKGYYDREIWLEAN